MPDHPFESLERRLRAAGVPSGRVRRIVIELTDHLECLQRELTVEAVGNVAQAARERIGTDETLLRHFLCDERTIAFAQRRPFATFVLAPIPVALTLGGLALTLACGGYEVLVNALGVQPDGSFLRAAVPWSQACVYAIVGLVTLSFFGLAWRSRVSMAWPSIALGLLTALGCAACVRIALPMGGPGTGVVEVSLRLMAPLLAIPCFIVLLASIALVVKARCARA